MVPQIPHDAKGGIKILLQASKLDGSTREIQQTEKAVSDDVENESKNGSFQCGVPLADDPEVPGDEMTNDDIQNYLHDFPKKKCFPDGPMCYEVDDPKLAKGSNGEISEEQWIMMT